MATFLNSREARNAYNNGNILENRNSRFYVTAFQFCGFHFTSTSKRATKGAHYRLDNGWWCIVDGGIITKLKLIVTGNVTIIT